MIEIEKKYLVNEKWSAPKKGGEYFRQGYLAEEGATTRVRIISPKGNEADKHAYLTIKGKTVGISRPEFEYEIPVEDAENMLKMALYPIIEKFRYRVNYGGKIWEVDEFLGFHKGLIVAEIELSSENEAFDVPEWVGEEVSLDRSYSNAALSRKAAQILALQQKLNA
ncbi:MAG: CYTH domain-containing protein [Paludibacteraceae bacterium]|nr:CYTH domain-containing protein [Paludibacteraceae bacterium]